jgi:hypothetical protein
MILLDANGKTISTQAFKASDTASLKDKLQSSVPYAASNGGLDTARPIYVYLEDEERQRFLRSYRESRWVPFNEGQVFSEQTEKFISALKAISDEINDNDTNGYGRFLPLIARKITSDPLGIETLYGWYYLAVPEEIRIDDNTKIQVVFS